MKRYLVTTAEELTWRKDRPLLFLGNWCLRHDRRAAWEALDYAVAEPINISSADRKQAVVQVQALTGQLLPELTAALNRYHGVLHRQRYWQILLGHWLQRWVSTACNRYLTLQRALDSYEVEGTTLLRPRNYSLATKDSLAYIWATNDDLWNHVLWGEVLSHLKADTPEPTFIEIDTAPCFDDPRPEPSSNSSIRGMLRAVGSAVLPRLARKTDAVIIGSYLPLAVEVRLNLALRQLPQRWQTPVISFPLPGDRSMLAHELSAPGESGAAGFVRDLLPRVLPSCFVEGYRNLSAEAEALPWPSQPRFIFTSNNFDTDEVFKAWTALKSEQGIPYFTGQHGNNYGTHFYFGNQNWPERSASDGFFTWGWSDSRMDTFAAFNFKVASRGSMMDAKGGLLLIETSVEHRFSPWDVTSDHLLYLSQQLRFVDALPNPIRQVLTVRLPIGANCFPHCESMRWAESQPGLTLDHGLKTFNSLVRRNRLVVFSYDSTGILEMLATNRPFICFWPGKWDHLESSAIPYYESLREVGIFQESAEAAAQMVASIWADVSGWWGSAQVQRARERFCDRYSRVSVAPARTLAGLFDQAVHRV
jgi:putative transferase (TIGR04331 family)